MLSILLALTIKLRNYSQMKMVFDNARHLNPGQLYVVHRQHHRAFWNYPYGCPLVCARAKIALVDHR